MYIDEPRGALSSVQVHAQKPLVWHPKLFHWERLFWEAVFEESVETKNGPDYLKVCSVDH